MPGARLTGAKPFSTGGSPTQKGGSLRRKNQARERHEVVGGGRRPRYSFRSQARIGLTGGSEVGGIHIGTIAVPRSGRGRPRQKPARVITDKGYDADWLRKSLKKRGIELICPHRRGRKRPSMQDGRSLRRYRKRWKVERTFAWLGNFRRLLVRHERLITVYSAFFHPACLLITLRHL